MKGAADFSIIIKSNIMYNYNKQKHFRFSGEKAENIPEFL
jgi:hypothetical protein